MDERAVDIIKIQSKSVEGMEDRKFSEFDGTESHIFADFGKMENEYCNDLIKSGDSTKSEQCDSLKRIDFEKVSKIISDKNLVANYIERDLRDDKSMTNSYLDVSNKLDYRGILTEKISCYREFEQSEHCEFGNFDPDMSKVCKDVDTESTRSCSAGDNAICDDELDSDGHPTGERWPPLGAPNDDEDNQSLYSYSELSWQRGHYGRGYGGSGEEERLQQLEEEQEQLNNSLMALTSHFAQVQFRLKQIVDASPEEKEILLLQLEEFANRGIPDLRDVSVRRKSAVSEHSEGVVDSIGITRQKELIEQLKQQLEDLENYVYQTGEGGPPQAKVMEKQRVIIEQLKGKLNLNVDELDKLTVDDLRVKVDHAIREVKEQLAR